jgi:hypothetical protein
MTVAIVPVERQLDLKALAAARTASGRDGQGRDARPPLRRAGSAAGQRRRCDVIDGSADATPCSWRR